MHPYGLFEIKGQFLDYTKACFIKKTQHDSCFHSDDIWGQFPQQLRKQNIPAFEQKKDLKMTGPHDWNAWTEQ